MRSNKLHIPNYGVIKLRRCEHACSTSEPAEMGQRLCQADVTSYNKTTKIQNL